MPAEKLDWLIPRKFSILSKPILGRDVKTKTSNISILLACSSRTNAKLLYVDKRCYVKSIWCWAVSLVVPDWQGIKAADHLSYAVTLSGPCVCVFVNGQLDRVSSRISILWRLTANKMTVDRFLRRLNIALAMIYKEGSINVSDCRWTTSLTGVRLIKSQGNVTIVCLTYENWLQKLEHWNLKMESFSY